MSAFRIRRRLLLGRRRLACNQDGLAAIEFAFIAPAFLMLLMAVFDLGFAIYAKAVLQGAVEDGARTASLENTQWAAIENRVNDQVRTVIPAADPDTDVSFDLDPTHYHNYSDVNMPEDFTDTNRNKRWDPEECFVDRNGNRTYDTDVGLENRGGAQDVVSIRAELEFKRAMPLWNMLGQPQTLTLSATTYLRNQPFGARAPQVGVRICP